MECESRSVTARDKCRFMVTSCNDPVQLIMHTNLHSWGLSRCYSLYFKVKQHGNFHSDDFHPLCLHTMLFTHSLTHSWSWALLEKLPVVNLLENFPPFYGTRRSITAFTWALHRSLTWARSIQSLPPHPTSLRSILILSTHLRLGLVNVFVTSLFFYGKAFLAPRPTPKMEDHPLWAFHDCLFNIFVASLNNWRASPPSATWGRAMPWWQGTHPHNVVSVIKSRIMR
jgi:hypothetical protein